MKASEAVARVESLIEGSGLYLAYIADVVSAKQFAQSDGPLPPGQYVFVKVTIAVPNSATPNEA